MKKILIILMLLYSGVQAMAQTRNVTGFVRDKDTNEPIAGVNVLVKGTGAGTATDADGRFSLSVAEANNTLVFSFIGYVTKEVTIPASNVVDVTLESAAGQLDEVVVSVGRGTQRTITDTPLPVDNFTNKDLVSTGQISFDKALQYRVPAFNTVQTPVNDATSLLDPYEIRNMGPSRTLILVNGKRKNASALIYVQTSPGRGEGGADLSAIPTDAIKRVEILRDGASAQYGSDAIAGVMNIILKDDKEQGAVTLRTGVTSEGDGGMLGLSLNNGSSLGSRGFLNYTLDFSKVGLASRSGNVSAEGEAGDFGAPLVDVEDFLAEMPDAGNINGAPETTAAKFLINGGVDLNDETSIYFNAAYVYKKVNSFANYRTPYWRTLAAYPYLADFFGDGTAASYKGYVPTFDGDLNDYNATIGIKSVKNDWNTDVSLTIGGNKQLWSVRNSHNGNTAGLKNPDQWLGDQNGNGVVDSVEYVKGTLKYRENSPVTFRAGGVQFNHIVGNIDVSRTLSDKITFGFGSEFRSETFAQIEGDLASYEAGGADSYAGNSAENSFRANRYNLGGYATFGFDLTEDFLIDITGRYENYSDFGDAFVYKVSSRYKFADDKITVRGSYSTGFRAPSLHQIYTQKAQYSFVPGQGIQVSGLVNNVSKEAQIMGIENLNAEKSTNFTVGMGLRPFDNFSLTIDYYDIKVEDRIVLSNELDASSIPALNDLFSVSFFSNAIDTRTSGIDVVGSYGGLGLGRGTMRFNFAANFQTKNERDGAIRNPEFADNTGQEVIDDTQEALLFTSRPKFKAILGADYTIGKFNFALNGTVFGPTEFRNAGMSSDLKVEFKTKLVTDLAVTFNATEKITLALNINNIFNVLPEWEFVALNQDGRDLLASTAPDPNYFGLTPKEVQSNLITFNQRYPIVTYDGSHFSQLGTILNFAVSWKL